MATAAPLAVPRELRHLPPRLLRFFNKFPPHLYSAKHTGVVLPLTRQEAKEHKIAEAAAKRQIEQSSSNITQSEGQTTEPSILDAASLQPSDSPLPPSSSEGQGPIPTTDGDRIVDGTSRATRFPPNPFLPFRNPATGHWAGSRISLRVQADLVKLAKKHEIEHLLPPGRKSTAFKNARTLERGLRVRGTGEGQKVKGHQWEREMPALLEKRKKALEEMPALVREWQARGHGRGWKKWPKVRGPR